MAEQEQPVSRREFLKTASLIGAGVALGGAASAQQPSGGMPQNQEMPPPTTGQTASTPAGVNQSAPSQSSRKVTGALGSTAPGPTAPKAVLSGPAAGAGEIPQRPLGKTGLTVSALGMGGHHLGDADSVNEAMNLVHEAVDTGITFFDNCWEYHNGKSEDWLGRALTGGRRDKVVLMTKVCTHGRTKQVAMEMLEQSLRRLQTDHLDVWQVHAITYDNDPELAYAKNGVLEAFDLAKQQGKVRYVGFTGHKDPGFHLKMLDGGYPFDTVQMPLNPFDHSFFSFEQQVLPVLVQKGIAPLGMKSMVGAGEPIKQGLLTAEEMLRYAMSLPVATTISGMESLDVLHQNLRVARGFQPMTQDEMQELRVRCAPVAADGRFEPYKVSLKFDNPVTRYPHGFPVDPQIKEVKDMLTTGIGIPGTALLTPSM